MTDMGNIFRELHKSGDPFVLANAYDIGSAKVLTALGAKAIGTTSSGHAFTLGRPDMGNVTRDEAMAHAQDIVANTHLPVSGDLENGYGDAPEDVEETVRRAAEVGLAGCSIEDTRMSDQSAYDFELSVERVRAGAAQARALSSDFVFVARADGVMNEFYDLDESIRRIVAYDEAGADCVYVPLPPSMEALERICKATSKPVNALAVGKFAKVSKAEFARAGVARISVGSGLARVTHNALINAANKMLGDGDFSAILDAAPGSKVDALLQSDGNN